MLETPDHTAKPPKLADLLGALSEPAQPADPSFPDPQNDDADCPQCPYCSSTRTRLLTEYPRCSGP